MEIKAELKHPYTKEERMNFIVEYNRSYNYEIKEYTTSQTKQEEIENPETGETEIVEFTEIINHLEAWGYTQEELKQKEKERIGRLECTKRVFILMLEELGISYFNTIKPLIESNPQAQLEWELCVQLQRKNPLLDVVGGQLGVTSEQLDNLFKFANGEITLEDFKGSTSEEVSESNSEVEADGE